MARRPETEPDARAPLSRARVVGAAMELADVHGVEGLSMRVLARRLGAGAMSLYHHVADKDALLDGMVDLVFTEIEWPNDAADWRVAMRRRAVATRDALARHPWAIPLMESRSHPGPANLHHRERVLGTLRRGGFSVVTAAHANWLLDSYVYGYALQVANLPFDTPVALADMTDAVFLPQLPRDRFPYLFEAATELVAKGYDPAAEFEFGLDLILEALEPLRGRTGPVPGTA